MVGASRALGAGQPRGVHVLMRLREGGHITAGQYDAALASAKRSNERVEETLIAQGMLSESELLRLLASFYGTRFVSTERLSKAQIPRELLERIPFQFAKRLAVFPILHDARSLSVVVAAPGEDEIEKQVQMVSGVRLVRPYVARPAAIRAAIARYYRNDRQAFDALLSRAPIEIGQVPPEAASSSQVAVDFEDPFASTGLDGPGSGAVGAFGGPIAPESSGAGISAGFDDATVQTLAPLEIGLGGLEDFAETNPQLAPSPQPELSEPITLDMVAEKPPSAPPMLEISGGISLDAGRVTREAYLETLNVFVSLLEQDRDDVRGHSAQVARLCRLMAERVGLSLDDQHALVVAAYLHDVGKGGADHLTALNVARSEKHRAQAEARRTTPLRLFASAELPEQTNKILGHLYERYDGQGVPDRLSAKDIPYGSRVLSLVETYVDLVANPSNPYRRVLTVPEALNVVRDLGGQLFDPTLAELLRHVVVGEDSAAVGGQPKVLLVDPDPEETTVLEMRLIDHGFQVAVARDGDERARTMLAEGVDVVITEVDLGGSVDGFQLLTHIRSMDGERRPQVIILTERSDRESVARGFDLGALDYLVKPASAELVATKAGQAVEAAARDAAGGAGKGVSGALKEMSLPDVIQILSNGRRGGKLEVVSGARRGAIFFQDGEIHDAMCGSLSGAEAFYALMKLEDGTFMLDPAGAPRDRTIQDATDSLLLEAMRRLDENI